MPKTRPCVCRVCGRTEAEAGRISHTARCADCATKAMLEARRQIQNREGPIYDHWLLGFANAISARIAARRAESLD